MYAALNSINLGKSVSLTKNGGKDAMEKYSYLLFNTTMNEDGYVVDKHNTSEFVTEQRFAFTDLDARRLLDMKDKLLLTWR